MQGAGARIEVQRADLPLSDSPLSDLPLGDLPLTEMLDLLTERIALYRVDDLTVVYCNRAWARANGARPDDLIGRTMPEVLSAAEVDGLLRQVARLSVTTPLLSNNVLRAEDRWIEWTDLYLPRSGGAQVLAVGRDVTERQAAEVRLLGSEARYRDLALRDPLTGLANRRLLEELLGSALARGRRGERCLVVSYLDLDDFKGINDRHGHAVGDGVLSEFSRRLEDGIRDADVIARVGGDEFVVVQECRSDQAGRLSARLAAVLDEPIETLGVTLHCHASVGSVVAEEYQDAASAVAAADAAMYAVKRRR